MIEREDNETIQAMLRYGGSFVQALAGAAQVADPDNLEKIKTAWPAYWSRYQELARLHAAKEQ